MYTSELPLDVNYSNQIIEEQLLAITNTQFVGSVHPQYHQMPSIVIPLAVSLSSFRDYNSASKLFSFVLRGEIETINQRIEKYLPKIVREIKENNDLFKDIDEEKVIKKLKIVFSKINSVDLLYINKTELENRIIKILSVTKLSTIIDDLSIDQRQDFHESIKRRPFFE